MDVNIKSIQQLATDGWLKSVWEFVSDYNIRLTREDGNNSRTLQNERDSYIMYDVGSKNQWGIQEMKKFNACRMYLQVELLSDIVTADGKAIQQTMWQGRKDVGNNCRVKYFFQQERPGETAWSLWRNMLKRTYGCSDTRKLGVSMGAFKRTADWKWLFDPVTDRLYNIIGNQEAEVYTRVLQGRITRSCQYGNCTKTSDIPINMAPVTVYKHGIFIKIDGKGELGDKENLRNKSNWYASTTNEIVGNINLLVELLQTEEIIIMCDGSEKKGCAAAAWIISTKTAFENNNYIQGYGKIPEKNSDPFRAECFGILGGILTWVHYSKVWDIEQSRIKLFCDNVTAVKIAGGSKHRFVTSKLNDFDIIRAIREEKKNLKDIIFAHIKGHKDLTEEVLSIEDRMNIRVDELAKAANTVNDGDICNNYSLPHEQWQLYVGCIKITKNIERHIRDYVHKPSIQQFWQRKGKINEEHFDSVNWTAIASASKSSKNSTRQWVSKRMAKDCGANAILFKRKQKNTDECPFCSQSESAIHIYQCKSKEVQDTWDQEIKKFQEQLVEARTYPLIVEQLLLGMNQWRKGEKVAEHELLYRQTEIGWDGILEGCLSSKWMEWQETYLQNESIQRSSHKWAELVVRKIWKIAWAMWQHRNQKEHYNDNIKELNELRSKVDLEISKGTQQIRELEILFSNNTLEKVKQGDRGYMTAWLRNVTARRKWVERQENSHEMTSMRRIMHRFLIGNSNSNTK
jgi:hypothetical protein